ncbi:MAG: DUF3341 domain-containing protein [Elusimicrobia bacterium]|nr:DUF3341 domain-containing protein [Elusimicrobiota bacterium]
MATELVVGIFRTEHDIVAAARNARAAGFTIQDAYTPFAVHGLDTAMGLSPSFLPLACLGFGAAGLATALSFEYWATRIDWPMIIGGKSYSAIPALIPIGFELTVLFASVGSVLTFLLTRGLIPNPEKVPALSNLGGLNDRFVLALRRGGDGEALRRLLSDAGAVEVKEESLQ